MHRLIPDPPHFMIPPLASKFAPVQVRSLSVKLQLETLTLVEIEDIRSVCLV